MPDLNWNHATWADPAQWIDDGERWSEPWGGSEAQWHGSIFPRIARWLPASSTLEIGPGCGRWTRFLLRQTKAYWGVDESRLCIERCQCRFNERHNAHFIRNDGFSLSAIEDDSIDFAFSFDSLVHAERDVVESYCRQILRKLRPSGVAFVHHSNAAMGVDPGWPAHQQGRAPSVSRTVVRDAIERAGGRILVQEEINWKSEKRIDCLTTFCHEGAHSTPPTVTIENDHFMAEKELIRTSIARYHPRTAP